MSSPDFKIYDAQKQYQGCCKEAHAAAILAQHYRGTVRFGHGVKETVFNAADDADAGTLRVSNDACAALIWDRLKEMQRQRNQQREAEKARLAERRQYENWEQHPECFSSHP
jgi:hypothetical protein